MSNIVDTFKADNRYRRQMAQGHLMRKGHALTGNYVATADAGIVRLVRTCCKD